VKAQYITTQSHTIRGRLKIPSTTVASFIEKLSKVSESLTCMVAQEKIFNSAEE
jgi:hypothetical protein